MSEENDESEYLSSERLDEIENENYRAYEY